MKTNVFNESQMNNTRLSFLSAVSKSDEKCQLNFPLFASCQSSFAICLLTLFRPSFIQTFASQLRPKTESSHQKWVNKV